MKRKLKRDESPVEVEQLEEGVDDIAEGEQEGRTETAHELKAYLVFIDRNEYDQFKDLFNRIAVMTYGKKESEISREQAGTALIKVMSNHIDAIYNR